MIFFKYNLTRILAAVFLAILPFFSVAQEDKRSYDPKIHVDRFGSKFEIYATVFTPVTACESYSFITDYEDAKNYPGIIESRVLKREGNKIFVERIIEEQILFFPITIYSVIEFVESPNQVLNFKQIKGDSESYSGSWHLQAVEDGTQIWYQSVVELKTAIPNFVIEYFLKHDLTRRFLFMAERLKKSQDVLSLACK